jgi:hypothetical protein
MLGVFSTGDLIAIAVAVVVNAVTIGVTLFVQLREDRRALSAEAWRRATDKQQQVEGYFASILLSAGLIQGMTGIFNWKSDDKRSEAEREDLYATLRRIQADLQNASVHLTVLGVKEPVDMIDELFRNFTEFRRGLANMSEPGVRSEMIEKKKAIDNLRERLESDLPRILTLLEPMKPTFVGAVGGWPWRRNEGSASD